MIKKLYINEYITIPQFFIYIIFYDMYIDWIVWYFWMLSLMILFSVLYWMHRHYLLK